MSHFSPELCSNLLSKQLQVFPDTNVWGDFVFRGPCSVRSYSMIMRSKIDMFSVLNFYSGCFTSKIGRYCSIGKFVCLGMHRHDPSAFSTCHVFDEDNTFKFADYIFKYHTNDFIKRHGEKTSCVNVGHDVWIGDMVVIPSDVVIGHGAVIGTGAVITKDVPPYTIVVGNNRIIRQRFSDEIISDLMELQWWNYNIPEMMKHGFEFDVKDPVTCIQRLKDCDPSKLIPIPKGGILLELGSKAPLLDSVELTPVNFDDIKLYFDPRHPY